MNSIKRLPLLSEVLYRAHLVCLLLNKYILCFIHDIIYAVDNLLLLFVKTKIGTGLICDEGIYIYIHVYASLLALFCLTFQISITGTFLILGVYTRNRNFRLILSSKLSKTIYLTLANENKFKVWGYESIIIIIIILIHCNNSIELTKKSSDTIKKDSISESFHGLSCLQCEVLKIS